VKPFALFSVAFAVLGLCAPAAAFARASETAVTPSVEVSAPIVDVFEEGDCRLRLVALPSADLETTQVTLVYEDRSSRTIRAVTVNPEVAASTADERFNAFLAAMDEDFKSYVRATLADRLLHLASDASVADRAVAAVFFGSPALRTASVRRVSAIESSAE